MLGIDIEQISRFKNFNTAKLKRIFTDNEIDYALKFNNSSERFCGLFCVKEAFVKAVENKKIAYKKIEVLHSNTGKPFIDLNKEICSILKTFNKTNIEISISHTAEYAVAVVMIN